MSFRAIAWVTTAAVLAGCSARRPPFRPPPDAREVRVELGGSVPGTHDLALVIDIDTGRQAPSQPQFSELAVMIWADATWNLSTSEDPCRTAGCRLILDRGSIDESGILVGFPDGVFRDAKSVRAWHYKKGARAWIGGAQVPGESIQRAPI